MVTSPSPTVEGYIHPSRSLASRSVSSTQVVTRSGRDDSRSAGIRTSGVTVIGTAVEQSGRPVFPIASDLVGHTAGGHSPAGVAREDVIAFGGIPDRRFSHRIQGQPDVDDIQMGRAMRAAKLRDIEVQTGMSVNTSCSILHFSEHDIIDKDNNLGISLGSNDKETAKSINDLLDLETDRVVDLIRHLAAVKPMNEADINDLGVTALQSLCEDLVPTEGLEAERRIWFQRGMWSLCSQRPLLTPVLNMSRR